MSEAPGRPDVSGTPPPPPGSAARLPFPPAGQAPAPAPASLAIAAPAPPTPLVSPTTFAAPPAAGVPAIPVAPLTPDVAAVLEGGLGTPTPTPIAVLPPIDQLDIGPKLSPKTGEPTRPTVLAVATGFFALAAVVSAVTLAFVWWTAIHMPTWDHAARIIELLDPRTDPATERYAGTWQSILAAVLLVATGVVTVASPWLAAFNAWSGWRWARVFALVSVGIAGLAWFMTTGTPTLTPASQWLTWVPWIAVPACLVGAVLVWLPAVGRFFADFITVRAGAVRTPAPTDGIQYGPLERYR